MAISCFSCIVYMTCFASTRPQVRRGNLTWRVTGSKFSYGTCFYGPYLPSISLRFPLSTYRYQVDCKDLVETVHFSSVKVCEVFLSIYLVCRSLWTERRPPCEAYAKGR